MAIQLAEVTRYDSTRDGDMEPYQDGPYVRYSDYTTLLQEVETLRAELGKFSERNVYALRQQLAHARQEVETLREQLARWDQMSAVQIGIIENRTKALAHARQETLEEAAKAIEEHDGWDMHPKDYAKLVRALQHTGEVPGYVGFTEQTAAIFKAAGYNPQLIWFSDKGGEWQLWLYPRNAMAFSTHFSGQSIAAVVQQGLAALEDGETKP